MEEHYFTETPSSKRSIKEINLKIKGINFRFLTDKGVFSRGRLDRGTKLLIETMDVSESLKILDLGCGYGPIGICAAKFSPESEVVMIDINSRAYELAKQNIKLNQLANARVFLGDGFEPVSDMKFDLILFNPPIRAGKQLVFSLIARSKEFLNQAGALLVVARTKQGSKSILRYMSEVFDIASEIKKGGGYRVMKGVDS